MTSTAAKFARMLTEAIRRIQSLESKNISVIQDELGYVVGRSGATIEYWRKGHLPAQDSQIEQIVVEVAKRTDYSTTWLEEFLVAAGYHSPQTLSAKLRPIPVQIGKNHPSDPDRGQLLIPAQEPHLPSRTETFVDRPRELLHAVHELKTAHFSIINGMAGTGKTTLAAELVHRVKRTRDRIFWHSIAPGENIDDIIWRLANHLAWYGQENFLRALQSPRVPPHNTVLDSLLYTIREKNYLLCFDDFHLLDQQTAAEQLVKPLEIYVKRGEIDLLIISRHEVNVRSIVSSSELPGFTKKETEEFFRTLAITLSVEQVTFLHTITQGNPQLLMLLSGALKQTEDRESFSLEIATVPSLESYILREIDDQLSEDERTLMRTAAILQDHLSARDILRALSDVRDVWTTLNNLTRRNLLNVHRYSGEKRYSQHAMVSSFYYDSIEPAEKRKLHRRAGAYFANAGDAVNAALQFEHADDIDRVAQLIVENLWSFVHQGRARFAATALEKYLQEADGTDTVSLQKSKLMLTSTLALGTICRIQGLYQQALIHYESGLKRTPTAEVEPQFLYEIGYVYEAQGDYATAMDYYSRSLEACRKQNSRSHVAKPYFGLGWAHYRLGNLDEARRNFDCALEHAAVQDSDLIGRTKLGLGSIDWQKGHLARALTCFEECQSIFRSSGDIIGEAQTMNNIGAVYYELGNIETTLSYWDQMIEIFEDIGDVTNLMFGHNNLGFVHLRRQEHQAADDHYARMEEIAQRTGNLRMLSRAYSGRAEAKILIHAVKEALDVATKALELAEAYAYEAEKGIAGWITGRAYLALDDPEQANDYLKSSVEALEAASEHNYSQLAKGDLARALAATRKD